MAKAKAKATDLKVKRKPNKLTVKQKRFIKHTINGESGIQAVKKAGYKQNTAVGAGVQANRLLKNDKIRLAVEEGLEEAGLTNSKIFEHLEHTITSGVGKEAKNSDAIRSLDMIFKLKGAYAPKESKVTATTINLDLQGKTDDDLMDLLNNQASKVQDVITVDEEE